MKGYIKIEATVKEGREGLSVETDLRDVSCLDRLNAVHSLCTVLEITSEELQLLASMMKSGVMDSIGEVEVIHDETVRADRPSSGSLADLLKMLLS
ncbi:MAG: hypothetical protein ACI4T5_06010 [Prevotella sp.]